MWLVRSGHKRYLRCKNASNGRVCSMRTTVPVDKCEAALLDFVCQILRAYPDWMQRTVSHMRATIAAAAERLPPEIEADCKRVAELADEIERLVDLLMASPNSEALRKRLADSEAKVPRLQEQIKAAEGLLVVPTQVPDDKWIAEQFVQLTGVLREDSSNAAILLRKLLSTVHVHEVIPTGKKRGWPQLRFTISILDSLREVLAGRIPDGVLSLLVGRTTESATSSEIPLDLGGPSRMDQWGPKIVAMRKAKVSWEDICKITGLGSGPAFVAWKRCADAEAQNPQESDDHNAA